MVELTRTFLIPESHPLAVWLSVPLPSVQVPPRTVHCVPRVFVVNVSASTWLVGTDAPGSVAWSKRLCVGP